MARTPTPAAPEADGLAAARAGDEDAFRAIVDAYRGELHAHCYRMLGSLDDAEDALQETFLHAWRGRSLPSGSGRPADLNADPGAPLAESVWVEPYPDDAFALPDGYAAPDARYEQREAVELAFVAALQHLSGNQRAVLILREVLGFSAQEVSESLDTSVASVNSALQRARKAIAERLPDRSQQEVLRALGNRGVRTLVERYVDAWARGDVDALTRLLAADAVFSMPPWAMWWRGSDTIAAMAKDAVEICANGHAVPISANGQPAVAYWALNDETGRHEAMAIDVLTLEGDRVKEITAFISPGLFPRFGLPSELAPPASR